MKALLMILTLSAMTGVAQARDFSKAEWICREAVNGAIVADGAKALTISKDRLGTYTLDVVQKDQFMGDQKLIDGAIVQREKCSGFTACEAYTGDSIKFFVNLMPNSPIQQAQLEVNDEYIEFACRRN